MGSMWSAYAVFLREAEENLREGSVPPVVTAVARAAGLDPAALYDRIEACLGSEAHDMGYEYTTWFTAWAMKGHPDWQEAVCAACLRSCRDGFPSAGS